MPNLTDYSLEQWCHPDLDYIATRDSFIQEAEQHANKLVGKKFRGGTEKERLAWTARWNLEYHKRINWLYENRSIL